MGKSKNNKYNRWYEDEDDISRSKFEEQKKIKKKQKLLNAALKCKNVNRLMEFDDQE